MTDTITPALQAELQARAAVGMKKYGVSLSGAPLSLRDALQMAKEEALDQAAYLQKAIEEIDRTAGGFW